jgi:hypothetical protein
MKNNNNTIDLKNDNLITNDNESSSNEDDYTSNESEGSTEEQEVVFRKIHYNELRKEVLKNEFDKNKIHTLSDNFSEEDKILREKVDIADERKELKYDLKLVNKAELAVDKMSEGKVPASSEYKAFCTIENKYDTFFEEKEIGDNINYNERKESISSVKEYVVGELKANSQRKKEFSSFELLNETQPTKRKFIEDDESEMSSPKRVESQSPSDYIDSLPQEYNPFDDISND